MQLCIFLELLGFLLIHRFQNRVIGEVKKIIKFVLISLFFNKSYVVFAFFQLLLFKFIITINQVSGDTTEVKGGNEIVGLVSAS